MIINYKNIQTLAFSREITEIDLTANSANNFGPLYADATYTASGSRNFKGWGYGLGLKTLLTNNFYLQVEAEYIDYKSQSVTGTDDIVYKFKPESLSGTISIGYKF